MGDAIKVSSRSSPNSVAGALVGLLRAGGSVEIQVVGAGALNQAVKGIAIARGYLTPVNFDLACRPTFADIQIDGESRTAIRLLVESFPARSPVGPYLAPPTKVAGAGQATPPGRVIDVSNHPLPSLDEMPSPPARGLGMKSPG